MLIHNVIDRRNGWIGSYRVEPFNVDDAGKTISVIYKPSVGSPEKGLLSSIRGNIIFVLFTKGDTAAGCNIGDLYRVISSHNK